MRSMNPPQQPSSCLSEERELVRKPREKFTLKRWIDHLELEADKAERVAKEARLKAESANAERFRRLQEAQVKAEAYAAKRALEVERERKEKAREEEARKAKEVKEKAKRLKEEEYKKAAKIKEEVKRLREEELRKGLEEARLKEEEAQRAKTSFKTLKKEDAESTTSLPPPPLSATLNRIGHLAHIRQHSRLLPLIQYFSLDLYKKTTTISIPTLTLRIFNPLPLFAQLSALRLLDTSSQKFPPRLSSSTSSFTTLRISQREESRQHFKIYLISLLICTRNFGKAVLQRRSTPLLCQRLLTLCGE